MPQNNEMDTCKGIPEDRLGQYVQMKVNYKSWRQIKVINESIKFAFKRISNKIVGAY